MTWCSFAGVITALTGLSRIDQAATAGSPTIELSLKGAMVSSVMYLARGSAHSPFCSNRMAPTRGVMAASLGKMR